MPDLVFMQKHYTSRARVALAMCPSISTRGNKFFAKWVRTRALARPGQRQWVQSDFSLEPVLFWWWSYLPWYSSLRSSSGHRLHVAVQGSTVPRMRRRDRRHTHPHIRERCVDLRIYNVHNNYYVHIMYIRTHYVRMFVVNWAATLPCSAALEAFRGTFCLFGSLTWRIITALHVNKPNKIMSDSDRLKEKV